MKQAAMYSPCANCPFRTDRPGFLTKQRAREIASGLDDDWTTFHCHKTVDYGESDEGRIVPDRSMTCAGYAILGEREGKIPLVLRFATYLGLYDRSKLDMDAPVHKSRADFIKAQGR